ncbi:MAG: hypothetical protein Q8P20_00680 [bacterium]|nr:hypothetical protein [bacterium]
MQKLNISFGLQDNVGLICLWTDGYNPLHDQPWYALHLFIPHKRDWRCGINEYWLDGPVKEWGLGPLFLLVRYYDF